MSGHFRMIAVGAALTLIISHGDLAAQTRLAIEVKVAIAPTP